MIYPYEDGRLLLDALYDVDCDLEMGGIKKTERLVHVVTLEKLLQHYKGYLMDELSDINDCQ